MVTKHFGAELLVNNSWSGSRVTKKPENDDLFPSGCSDERCGNMHIGPVVPDVIIVFMGTNDWKYGVDVKNDKSTINKDDNYYFDPSYGKMIYKIKKDYPETEIWCCTLTYASQTNDNNFDFPLTNDLKRIGSFCDVIKEKANDAGCGIIDLYGYNEPFDSFDGTHPTKNGMKTIASMMIRSMTEP